MRILDKAALGEEYIVLDDSATDGWTKIEYNGEEGYIYADYLAIQEPSPLMVANDGLNESEVSALVPNDAMDVDYLICG